MGMKPKTFGRGTRKRTQEPWDWTYRAILSLQDMVSRRSPCSTPSQVWMVLLDLTGMVPSPDSILVLSWPRAFLLGCRSPWSGSTATTSYDLSHFNNYGNNCI